MPVEWFPIPVPDPEDNLQDSGPNNQRKIQHQLLSDARKVRDVAALFNRTEGSWWIEEGAIVFTATDAGPNELGQIWRLDVKEQTLELVAQPSNPEILQSPDNVTVAPWGDFIVCENGEAVDRLLGVTPEGEFDVFGRNALNDAEIAGANFSPDGRTLLVNVPQIGPGITLAIWGPWDKINRA
jgi:secreted PhoX family phosphatase